MLKGKYLIPALFTLLLALGGCVIFGSHLLSASKMAVSREALFANFQSDIANMVYEWDCNDLTSDVERRQALFDFMYATYNTANWIPQSLLLSNFITQAVVGNADTIVRDRIGVPLWPENEFVKAYGMAPNPARDQPLGWTVNCVICHAAEIDGVVYLGAGSKVFDEKVIAEVMRTLTSDHGRLLLRRGSIDEKMAAHYNDILSRHHHSKLDSLTRARSTAFPASHVEFHMRAQNGAMPSPEEVGRGDVKTPPMWHVAAKMPFNRWYCDGSFHGELPLMASSMELEKDQTFDDLVRFVLPEIKEQFDALHIHLRPPRYPYTIDETLAAKGKEIFYSETVECSRCHGVYDGKGNVQWTGLHRDVGTDRARLNVVSKGFIDAFESSPLAKEGRLTKSRGYAATPLTGVWANYPYLHNGSVPTLYHLLGPEGERPRIFSVLAAREFDADRVGQTLYPKSAHEEMSETELLQKFGNDRDWFNASRPGCGSQGHDFWTRIRTDANREALIEYLKTL